MAVAKRNPSPAKTKSAARVKKSKKAVVRSAKKPAIRGVRSAAPAAAPLAQGSSPRSDTVTAGAAELANLLHHPKTAGGTSLAFDPLGLARPWMRFCVGVAATNLALQARMARAVFPPNNVLPAK